MDKQHNLRKIMEYKKMIADQETGKIVKHEKKEDNEMVITDEEKKVIEKILEVLKEKGLKYFYHENDPKSILIFLEIENKANVIYIHLHNERIIFRLQFPFVVQTSAIPLVVLLANDFNYDKAFSNLQVDIENGNITMKYSYLMFDSQKFDKKEFWIYMISLIVPAFELYSKLSRITVGMVDSKERIFYKDLLQKTINLLDGEYEDDSEVT